MSCAASSVFRAFPLICLNFELLELTNTSKSTSSFVWLNRERRSSLNFACAGGISIVGSCLRLYHCVSYA